MECACIDVDIDESGRLLSSKQVMAKKEHICCECHRKILSGERYLKEVCLFDGEFEQYKTCSDCHSVREHLFCSFYYTMLWDSVHEFIVEDADNLPYAKIGRLTKTVREKVCEIIERRWESE